MTYELNETHDPKARSWVESANATDTDFPIQNLPLGVFDDDKELPAIGVAIGDQVLDLSAVAEAELLPGIDEITSEALLEDSLNVLMALGDERWRALRRAIFGLLRQGAPAEDEVARHLLPMARVKMMLPAVIGDYTDFYASIFHAEKVGSMFRPDSPLLPNYKWVPIAYHGRASSIVPSGAEVKRPLGQTKPAGADAPVFGPSKRLDYEVEVGVFIGPGNDQGEQIATGDAAQHVFGFCLVNDWSARDVQAWEYQPLGPFLAKNFATTISPWIVTAEALAPYRAPAFQRPPNDPSPLPYLFDERDQKSGGLDLTLEAALCTRRMREKNVPPQELSRGSFRDMYWTIAQMIAHHSSNGCNLEPGDLLASGTVSGNTKASRGCLLELTQNGTEPIQLPTGETRTFLEDGDEVIIRGYCQREGAARIGFGECRGTITKSGRTE
ncbi:MAG TPA: fumarylacetoacetase [Terriglobales bacterium]|nr:fumarylacetoacetase [Terriglobales bacterium]